MNQNVKKRLEQIAQNQSMDSFFEVLEMPDKDFDEAYPIMKENLKNIFKTPGMERQVREQLELTPIVDIEAEKAGIEKVIKEIKEDNTISENKKDIIIELLQGSLDVTLRIAKNPRDIVKVKVIKMDKDVILPKYAHETDAGADVCANETVEIQPHTTVIIKTGLKVAIPAGYEIQLRPRSGMSLKTSLRIANSPATIDAEYRGEIGVIAENTGDKILSITKGDKIAQMLIAPTPMIEWEEVSELDSTERGSGGYGSTDKS